MVNYFSFCIVSLNNPKTSILNEIAEKYRFSLQDISEQEAFTIVERLLVEFFDPYTGNARKHEIERLLSEFKDAPLFREYCLYFLCNSSSQYMTMFALSCLEVCTFFLQLLVMLKSIIKFE